MAKKTPINVNPSQFAYRHKVCRSCGATIDSSAKYCTACGKKKFFNEYNDYKLTTMKYCKKCGTVNDGGYQRCPECGRAHFISYDKHLAKQNLSEIFKVFGMFIDLILMLVLLSIGVWQHILTDGETWTGLLIAFSVYCTVMITCIILSNKNFGGVLGFFSAATLIVSAILIFQEEVAIWALPLCLAGLASNILFIIVWIGATKPFIKRQRVELAIYIIANILLLAACIFAVFKISSYGWSLYF